jgi:hypothetical protein
MKTKLFATLLLAGSSMFAQRVSVGVGVGVGAPVNGYYAPAPPVAPAYAYRRPAIPGPGYVWVDGYYGFAGGHYRWVNGYWSRPPYAGAYWVAPRYHGGRYYAGYWGRGYRR